MQQMAFDFLYIPAMSAECERVFSDTKLTISDNRCRLRAQIIEAIEYEGRWMRAGLGPTAGALYSYLEGTDIEQAALWGPRGPPHRG